MRRYDLIVLGGGISGLGVARASVSRSWSTLVLEAGVCGKATSDNTLRIVHGGFRYLQTLQIARVFRSLGDQSYVCRHYPDAIQSLPCLMPLARWGLKSRIPVTSAALTYGLAMRLTGSPLEVPRVISGGEFEKLFPELAERGSRGALCWHDAVMTQPALVSSQLVDEIASRGGVIQEGSEVQAVRQDPSGFVVATSKGDFLARRVINALGPWLDSVDVQDELRGIRPLWCKGFNIITRKQLHATHAIGIEGGGRLFFCVPRGEGTAIGTWYVPVPALCVTDKPVVSENELEQFLSAFNAALPEFQIVRDDIVAIDVGVLPMKREGSSGPQLYGSEIISFTRNYAEVMSTKYTTFRSQGERAISALE